MSGPGVKDRTYERSGVNTGQGGGCSPRSRSWASRLLTAGRIVDRRAEDVSPGMALVPEVTFV